MFFRSNDIPANKTPSSHHITHTHRHKPTLVFNVTALSLASSIEWCDREVVHMTRTEVVRSEGVDCLSDIGTVNTGDGSWIVLICHILDEDRVPDIMINTSHIQRPGSLPGDSD